MQLPPIPTTIRSLTNDQARWLNSTDPSSRVTVEKCVTCKGRKVFNWYSTMRDPKSVVEFECNCVDQFLLFRWLKYQGVSKRYLTFHWPDADNIPMPLMAYWEKASVYTDVGMGLVLTGRGSTKSFLGSFLLKDLIVGGKRGRMITFSEMAEKYADGWGKAEEDKESKRWFRRDVQDAAVLLIDSLGRERNQGLGSIGYNMLESVVHHRVSNQLPTIITTDLSEGEIQTAYGVRLLELLKESSVFVDLSACQIDTAKIFQNEIELGITARPILIGG